jgi:nicotinate-nucleotide adenylyltransferase
MRIGLYFGSFNPVHTGHLIIANSVINETDLERIWFVVSPQNPFKDDHDLLQARKRLALVKKSVIADERFFVSDVEFRLSKPSFTIHTLRHLRSAHPEHTFSVIMGSDSFDAIDKWKDFQSIISEYKIFIFRRQGFDVDNNIGANIEILNAPLIEISSTEIRELIRKGKSVRYLVPEKVRKEIEIKEYYKK